MTSLGILLDRAELAQLSGQIQEAATLYQEILRLDPNNPRALNRFGVLIHEVGQSAAALPYLEAATQLAAHDPEVWTSLGDCRRALGQPEQAEAAFRRALLFNPGHVQALNNLGLLLNDLGRSHEAVPLLETAAALRPDLAEIQNSLGLALTAAVGPEAAAGAYRAALAIRPDYPEALNNLGLALQRLGDVPGATAALEKALELRPGFFSAHSNLGGLCQATGKSDAAVGHYRAALESRADIPSLWLNLGSVLKQQGRTEEAAEAFDRALAIQPDAAIELRRALIMSPIQASAATIDADRARLVATLSALTARNAEIKDPQGQFGETAFFTAYHGQDDLPLLRQLVDTLIQACPSLGERLIDRAAWRRQPLNKRLRIGFLSKFLRNHTIGKLYAGLIETLPRDRFEIILLRQFGTVDSLCERIDASANKIVILPTSLDAARTTVANENLDLLFYPELGMDAFSWMLAFARLAPVQAMGWGHPVTSAMPAMDYFVTGGGFEVAGAEADYREQLVATLSPGVKYPMPMIDRSLTRNDLGLPTDRRVYACPQSLFKFHPDSDLAWARILTRDPTGVLVIVDAPEPRWNDMLRARFRANFGSASDRVLFIPRLSEARFAALYAQCDVALDPPYFGSGNTSLEAFAAGAPVITCPSRFMRTRLTAAFYRTMGITDAPIAKDLIEYADLAVDIACDPQRRADLSRRILSGMPSLFDRTDVVEDYADFFEAAIKAAHTGQPKISWGAPF